VSRLLNLYQFWLDDLYPRAKFADGLAIIEKLGHTKRIQTMRRQWIRGATAKESDPLQESSDRRASHPAREEVDVESPALDATEGSGTSWDPNANGQKDPGGDGLFLSDDEAHGNDQPPEDELDALLAEDGMLQTSTAGHVAADSSKPSTHGVEMAVREDDFADEEEAMAGMDDMW
jgi:replication fork protection complex subunit Csm3/Swi3